MSKIAAIVGNLEDPPIICGLARSVKKDIVACYEATKAAKFPRLHVFIAASDLHMEHKLKKTRAEVVFSLSVGIRHNYGSPGAGAHH